MAIKNIKYLLPSSITSLSLLAGCLAIINPTNHPSLPFIVILLATITDFLDGFVARITNAQTAFGAQLDSLCDMATFAIAPAYLWYHAAFAHTPMLGTLAVFLYVATTACRLARFNASGQNTQLSHFTGLPCPASAIFVVSLLWCYQLGYLTVQWAEQAIIILPLICCALQVSQLPFFSLKSISQASTALRLALIVIVLMLTIISYWYHPSMALILLSFIYLLHAIFLKARSCLCNKS